MSQALSAHQASQRPSAAHPRRRTATSRALWVVQGLLALVFLFAGSMKLMVPVEVLTAQMALPLPGLFLKFIGLAEVAGRWA
jgi:uncharacterized membrane protein YphA (DoxX/SURF4 family)